VVECLPSKCEALSSNLSTTQKQKKWICNSYLFCFTVKQGNIVLRSL
jgi:hypothetical protein